MFRRKVLLPLPGNGVRQATVTSTEQHSVQNTALQLVARNRADSIERTIEIFYLTAGGNISSDHNLNKLFTIVRITAVWSRHYIVLVITSCFCAR